MAVQEMNSAHLWRTDLGDIRLPTDFPFHAMRKSGWPDKRWSVSAKVFDYIEEIKRKMWADFCAGANAKIGDVDGPSFGVWQSKKS